MVGNCRKSLTETVVFSVDVTTSLYAIKGGDEDRGGGIHRFGEEGVVGLVCQCFVTNLRSCLYSFSIDFLAL